MLSLVTLPTELVVKIADSLPHDLKSFSSTNRRLRHAISPILFRTLNIACPLVSDMLLKHILIRNRHAIRRIHLHIRLRPNLPEDDTTEMPSIWGTDRSDILLQLVRGEVFSHVQSFSVRFDHLPNIRHMRLEGNVLSPLGVFSSSAASNRFPLVGYLPSLRTLEIKNIMLGNDFLDFIKAQADGLRQLTIHDCMCMAAHRGGQAQWADIWGTLQENSKAMRSVTLIQDERPPLPHNTKKDEELIVWRYVTLQEYFESVLEDRVANVEKVETGHDYQKYCGLMKLLADRREKAEE
ncbi:uncharacterized protein B0J16DRAFT_340272 [Fusarium flagelliforme]|uniref:uncharacterized protein n=1 Tax=Fusarium flagelliforme TaxID=2675880 RepID=UPI001E8EB82C|nr:uncharacterized protein B0J16DRAFT_340272 [Fusarium flagelliforme]KAH7184646.1 hypothetical protein B0J16DRAFT_340272 [Fusarium flagelliforme]